MIAQSWFPLPVVRESGSEDGVLCDAHPRCTTCSHRSCLRDRSVDSQLRLCSEGLCYARSTAEFIFGGFTCSDWAPSVQFGVNKTREYKRNRTNAGSSVARAIAERTIEKTRSATDEFAKIVQSDIRLRVESMITDDAMQSQIVKEIVSSAKPQQGVAHDVRQLLALISNHSDQLLSAYAPAGRWSDIDDPRDQRFAALKSIYYLSQLVGLRIDAIFYSEPEIAEDLKWRSLHGILLKFVRMYDVWARQKRVQVHISEFTDEVLVPVVAVETVVHSIMDNAVKYAPQNSVVSVQFERTRDGVEVRVVSLGPEIKANERERIFEAGFRADAARLQDEAGSGIGLWRARSSTLRGRWGVLSVDQAERVVDGLWFWTTFRLLIRDSRRK